MRVFRQTCRLPQLILAAGLIALTGILVIGAISNLPIEGTPLGWDWQLIWTPIQNGQVDYANGSMRVTPWGLPMLLPLSFLSFRLSWSIVTFITLIAYLLSVPRAAAPWLWALYAILLFTAYPAMRHIADGNIEGFILIGVLLIAFGYNRRRALPLGIGLLIATAKPQTVWLLAVWVSIYLLWRWQPRAWLRVGAVVLAVVMPTMLLYGEAWWAMMQVGHQVGTPVDVSLLASLGRQGYPTLLFAVLAILIVGISSLLALRQPQQLREPHIGMLISASMLISPYTSSISLVTAFAFAVIGMLPLRPRLGAALLILINSLYLVPHETMRAYGAYLITCLLTLMWALCAWHIAQQVRSAPATFQIESA
ncbi:MAG: DUF2029 domain-containing protein [Chloroflexota bacterium]|nr:MAG: DUF2029 domain-containing protein [Chloroflexota bacterium]